MSSPLVLFVDDDESLVRSLISGQKRRKPSYGFLSSLDSVQAIELALQKRPEVAVVDLELVPRIGPESGLELINKLLEIDDTLRVLVLTGHGSDYWGIEALKSGASSFLKKPLDHEHLKILIDDAIAHSRLRRSHKKLQLQSRKNSYLGTFSSKNKEMLELLEAAEYAASNNLPVLIYGETGTGKGVLAQAIHGFSAKKKGQLIRFQPNFSNQDLVASELFGHKKGAFTGALAERKGLIEEACSGTLFIDEVDELPEQTQVILLNVLQEKNFRRLGESTERKSSFRLISATNKPIEQSLSQKKLREDFYHRISHIKLKLPPLRKRKEDIAELSELFLSQIRTKENLEVQGMTERAKATLLEYSWPGNIRELQASIERVACRASYEKRRFIEASDLQLVEKEVFSTDESYPVLGVNTFRESVIKYENSLVLSAMKEAEDNQSRAAKLLSMDRSSFRRVLGRCR